MVAYAYNYSTREASLKITLPGVQGQPGLQGETLKKMPKKQKIQIVSKRQNTPPQKLHRTVTM